MEQPPAAPPVYKSALCNLSSAASQANIFDAEGYDVMWSYAVVAHDEEGKAIQAIYLLAKKREKHGAES